MQKMQNRKPTLPEPVNEVRINAGPTSRSGTPQPGRSATPSSQAGVTGGGVKKKKPNKKKK